MMQSASDLLLEATADSPQLTSTILEALGLAAQALLTRERHSCGSLVGRMVGTLLSHLCVVAPEAKAMVQEVAAALPGELKIIDYDRSQPWNPQLNRSPAPSGWS